MGAAKIRGTFEQRKAQAQLKQYRAERALEIAEKEMEDNMTPE